MKVWTKIMKISAADAIQMPEITSLKGKGLSGVWLLSFIYYDERFLHFIMMERDNRRGHIMGHPVYGDDF